MTSGWYCRRHSISARETRATDELDADEEGSLSQEGLRAWHERVLIGFYECQTTAMCIRRAGARVAKRVAGRGLIY